MNSENLVKIKKLYKLTKNYYNIVENSLHYLQTKGDAKK